jgi:hypothetical protein
MSEAAIAMARTNLHDLANRLLTGLSDAAQDGTFEGKLREVAAAAGLNSVRSAEAVKLLEELGRIEVLQRGRRGRSTVVAIRSMEPIRLEDAEAMLPSRTAKRGPRLDAADIGQAVVDRLLSLARDDGLRTAQVEAFDAENRAQRERVEELEMELEAARTRETELRVRLRSAEEALERAEENLRRAFAPAPARAGAGNAGAPVEDEDARAVLDILRGGSI